jgi:hypothetical protein
MQGHYWRCDRGHCDINQGALCGASDVSEIEGRRDLLSIDLGTESMPELGPGTKRPVSVIRAPPWTAVSQKLFNSRYLEGS